MNQYPASPPPAYPAGQTSTLAMISLISGILGWTILFGIASVAAVITGHMAKKEIRQSGGVLTGDGLASAGLILGYVNLAVVVLGFCLLIVLPLLGLGGFAACLPFMNGMQ